MDNATGTDQRNGPAVAGSEDLDVEGFLDRAVDQITQAQSALCYSNKQEAQHAVGFLHEATRSLYAAWSKVQKGKRSSEAPHGEAAEDGRPQVSTDA